MGFELFDKMSRTFSAKVSIRRNGNIGFSKGAAEKFGLRDKCYCKLYYDPERKHIGFEFTDKEQPDVTARVSKSGAGISIPASSFLNYYGINYSSTMVYTAEKDANTMFIIIKLKEPRYESQRGKMKK